MLATTQGIRNGKKWYFFILPLLFSISSLILLYFITIPLEKQFFILIASLLYYLASLGIWRLGKYDKDLTAQGMTTAAYFSSLFFVYSGTYGFYLNFLVPVYFLMIAFSVPTFLLSYQYFCITQKTTAKEAVVYSGLLALVSLEIAWVLNFWPFGYLTTGVVALILYYIVWELVKSYFFSQLSKKKVVFNMAFLSVLIGIVLFSSKWMPNF